MEHRQHSRFWKSLENQMLTMTKEIEIHVSYTLLTLKKGSSTLDVRLKKFKYICDKLAAMKKPLDDGTKVFHLARRLRISIPRFSHSNVIKTTISLL